MDTFLDSFVHARALKTAYDVGLLEALSASRPRSLEELQSICRLDRTGLELLLGLLAFSRVIETRTGGIRLSPEFRKALAFEDLLLTKLEFAHLVETDYSDGFTDLLADPSQFCRKSRIFELFGTSGSDRRDEYLRTQRWMRITTCLTKYEARAAMVLHDFGCYRRLLDIGGNSGEFALRLCERFVSLRAIVFDLPVVCEIGKRHVADAPEAGRIEFVGGTAFEDDLPEGCDLIAFKSMLHDWPEEASKLLLSRAAQVLEPGGTLLVFERGPFPLKERKWSYSLLPYLLFFRSFRSPGIYQDYLEQLGFHDIEIRFIELEMPFFLLAARR